MLGIIFELFDVLVLFKGISPFSKYENESIYWRITGIPLLVIAIGIWFLDSYVDSTMCVTISIISGVWLFINLFLRDAFVEEHKDKSVKETGMVNTSKKDKESGDSLN